MPQQKQRIRSEIRQLIKQQQTVSKRIISNIKKTTEQNPEGPEVNLQLENVQQMFTNMTVR